MSNRGKANTAPSTKKDSNLSRNKGMVLSALSNKVTNKFKSFCKTELMDRFLDACIEYFAAFFDLQHHLSEAEGEASKPPTRGSSPPPRKATASGVPMSPNSAAAVELEDVLAMRMREVAALYAAILVQHSNYANTQQDRQFFETLYDFSARVLFTINDRKRWHSIENELGRIFRSEHFNLSVRKNEQGTTKTLPTNRSGSPTSPRQRGRSSIHTAMHLRSPIIAAIFPTPKERMQRTAELQHSLGGAGSGPVDPRGLDDGASPMSGKEHSPSRGSIRMHTGEEIRAQPQQTPTRVLTSEELMDEKLAEAAQSFSNLVG